MRGEVLQAGVTQDEAIHIDDVDSPYAENEGLKKLVYDRGVDPAPAVPPAPDPLRNGRSAEPHSQLDPRTP